MSSWLTFVIGIIVGLLIGWLIDLLYRRTEKTSGLEPDESQAAPPAWATPLPEAAVAAEATTPPAETPVEEMGAEPENVEAAVLAEESGAPEELAVLEATREIEVPMASEDEISQEPEWPEVAERVAQVAEETETTPRTDPHVAAELPAEPEGLPPDTVDVLAPAAVAGAAEQAGAPVDGRDKLIIIEGIGPAYEARLRAAGINTFRQLAETSPEHLREIIQPQGWQRVNFAEWIEQARLIVEGKDEELKALQARLFSRKK